MSGRHLGFFRLAAAVRVSQVRMTEPEPWTRPKARDLLLELGEDRSTQPRPPICFSSSEKQRFCFLGFSRNLGRVCPSVSRYHDSACPHRKDNQRSNQKAKREFRGGRSLRAHRIGGETSLLWSCAWAS